MEVFLTIGAIAFVIFLVKIFSSSNKASRYKNILNQTANSFEEKGYKNSELYRQRIKHIDDVGLPTVISEIITEGRQIAIQGLNMKFDDFSNNESILLTEENFAMRYAFAHGKVEEFKEMLEMGRELQKNLYS